MARIKVTLGLLAAGALAVALAVWIGSARLNRSTTRLIETLLRASQAPDGGQVTFAGLEGLPPPVQRYLRHVLRDGQPLIRVARLSQGGELRTDGQSRRWLPFEANHIAAPLATGFVWDARVTMLPLLHVGVRDAYIRGQGSGLVSLLSAVPVSSDSGRPELGSGALHRYLAEAVWYPTALMSDKALKWSPIDSTKALATLNDAGLTVSLEFWFNDLGEVTGVYSPGRWRLVKGAYHQPPWEGHFSNYQERQGMLVPLHGEVGWYRAGEWQVVWKGKLSGAEYAF